MRANISYSETFKRQVVGELERGKYLTPRKAGKAYGITGAETVVQWVKKYGREDLLPKRIRVETMKERDELKEARKRIKELETAVTDAHVRYCLAQGYVKVACDRMGVDPEEFKKKHAMTLSEALRITRQDRL